MSIHLVFRVEMASPCDENTSSSALTSIRMSPASRMNYSDDKINNDSMIKLNEIVICSSRWPCCFNTSPPQSPFRTWPPPPLRFDKSAFCCPALIRFVWSGFNLDLWTLSTLYSALYLLTDLFTSTTDLRTLLKDVRMLIPCLDGVQVRLSLRPGLVRRVQNLVRVENSNFVTFPTRNLLTAARKCPQVLPRTFPDVLVTLSEVFKGFPAL